MVKFLRSSGEETGKKGFIETADKSDSGKIEIPEVEIGGKIMLADGVVKRNLGGKTDIVKICRTEEERLQALREYFGITLSEDEQQGIKGFETALV